MLVTEIDTIEEVYTVSLSVKDEADNEATAEPIIEVGYAVLSNKFRLQMVVFANDMTVDKPEWSHIYTRLGCSTSCYTNSIKKQEHLLSISQVVEMGSLGNQLFQDGYITLVQGKTYRLQVTAKHLLKEI